jgi:hypothetical protein
MYKAVRGTPLSPMQRVSVPRGIERCIGTLKRGYHFFRMWCMGLKKGQMKLTITAMAYNLKESGVDECLK